MSMALEVIIYMFVRSKWDFGGTNNHRRSI